MIKQVNRKSIIIRPSGRSSDFITPSFGFGCLLNCSYCYMKRHVPQGLSIAENTQDILNAINKHSSKLPDKVPNQTHKKYWTYDISCNEDFALHAKYHNWQAIFNNFVFNNKILGTFATKIIPEVFLNYNPNNKIRIRFSLMPQSISNILEPNTPSILDRIKAIDLFIKAGYEVHINYSPVVMYKDWRKDYQDLFSLVNKNVVNKDKVLSEVIFLTHNKNKHLYNLENNIKGEDLLWTPNIQEDKVSQYGGKNIRYKRHLKYQGIKVFKELHNNIIPWNKIRYIF